MYAPEDIIAMARRAIDLDPNLAEAHAGLGLALHISGQNDAAVVAYRKALSLDPLCHDAHHNFARYCRGQLDFERSAYHFIRALEIKPDDYRSPLLLIADLDVLGRVEERDRYLEMGVKRADEAVRCYPGYRDPLELSACVLAGVGRLEEARARLNRADEIDPDGRTNNGYNIACTLALLGETERALSWLEEIYPNLGHVQRDWTRNDPDFISLRDHPRFNKLISASEQKGM
jgi:adenylate cyclase